MTKRKKAREWYAVVYRNIVNSIAKTRKAALADHFEWGGSSLAEKDLEGWKLIKLREVTRRKRND